MPLWSYRSTLPVSSPFVATYALEVDWADDGNFTGTYDDLGSTLFDAQYYYGRDYASQLVGQSMAGTLRAHLLNTDGRYSSFNAASPLYGNLLPKRRVRLRSVNTDRNLWTGFLSGPPHPTAIQGTVPKAELNAVGPLALLGRSSLKISPPAMVHAKTGAIINAILDAAGWPAADRIIDAGEVTLGHWFVENIGVLEALQQIVEAEGGFLREGTNWDIVFEGRYHRFSSTPSAVSQGSFSDSAVAQLPYRGVTQDDPLRAIFNRVEVGVSQYRQDAAFVELWRMEPISLQPGESRTIIAAFTDRTVAFITTGLSTAKTVIPASIDASVTWTEVITAHRVAYTITNSHATLAAEVMLVLTGRPWREVSKSLVMREDVVSQGKYDLRTYPFSSPWFFNLAYADSAAQWVLATYKDPHPVMGLTFPIKPDDLWLQTVMRALSHRITLTANSVATQLGVNQDFYIEGMGLVLPHEGIPQFSMILSPANANPGYFTLDVSTLGGGAPIAY